MTALTPIQYIRIWWSDGLSEEQIWKTKFNCVAIALVVYVGVFWFHSLKIKLFLKMQVSIFIIIIITIIVLDVILGQLYMKVGIWKSTKTEIKPLKSYF